MRGITNLRSERMVLGRRILFASDYTDHTRE